MEGKERAGKRKGEGRDYGFGLEDQREPYGFREKDRGKTSS